MIVSDLAIDRRVTVLVLLVLIVVAGVFSYSALPLESNPEVIIPIIIVTTTYEGVAPQDMETLITIPIERELTGMKDVKQIRSSSAEGVSSIQIEFEADTEIDTALQRVRDKVDQAKPEIPVEADDPVLTEINVSEVPVMFVSLTGDVSPALLTEFAEDIEDRLEAVRGVLEVKVVGGVEREIQIIVDPERISAYGVALSELVQLAQVENVNTPAGAVKLGEARYTMRVPGEFESAAEIRDLVVKGGPEGAVFLRDVATVVDGFKEVTTLSRLDGQPAVTLTISKRAGTNVVAMADEIRGLLERERTRLLPGMELHITLDESDDIRNMVGELESSILSGLLLVIVIVFMFMGFTNAIFVASAIPISMLCTFTALYTGGTTLNMVTLFSLILALGMLVDNGIVVVENIYRHVQEGIPPFQAAKQGAGEVAWPVIASTLTTIAAFAPMFFWPGIWGSFMFYLPLTVTVALLSSLFVGLVVNPAMCSVFLRRNVRAAQREEKRHHFVIDAYLAVLRLALRWRAVTVTLAFTLLFVIGAVYFASAQIEFVPETEPRSAYVDVDLPEGSNLERTDSYVQKMEALAQRYRGDLDYLIANVGSRGVEIFGDGGGGETTHIGRVTLDFPKLETATVMPSAVIAELRSGLTQVAGAEIRIDKEEQGPPPEPPVNVEISGDDFGVLSTLADDIARAIADVPNIVDIRDDYEPGKPEVRVVVDRQRALQAGLNTQFIGLAVQTAVNGRKAGEYREGDDEYDVTVRFPEHFREDLAHLESMTIVNLNGEPIPFSAVARLEPGAGLGSITRINRNRTVTVSADTDGLRPGAEVLADVRERLQNMPLPAGYTVSYTGENEDQEESMLFLEQAFVVGLFLIALVLVTQFNSVLQPLIIMTSVILSLAGVFLGLWIHQMNFGVIMTGIGCISLAGVVVNNAIVLIDFINQRRREGLTCDEAILDAGRTRFRPVLLTAVTTVLGLIPMAAGVSFDFRTGHWVIGGESSQWWGPMAIAVIYGLSFATILTLVVVPVLYSLVVSLNPLDAGRAVPPPPSEPVAPVPAVSAV